MQVINFLEESVVSSFRVKVNLIVFFSIEKSDVNVFGNEQK
jgi:hypothetical protein